MRVDIHEGPIYTYIHIYYQYIYIYIYIYTTNEFVQPQLYHRNSKEKTIFYVLTAYSLLPARGGRQPFDRIQRYQTFK